MSTKKLQIIGSLSGKVDDTLTQAGQAADAKVTGDAINQMQVSIDEVVALVGDSSVVDQIAGKADVEHFHDDRYYTEVEIDNKISELHTSIDEKSDVEHIHAIADITDLHAELDSKYEKPSDGIPATDLTADVQESLNKANTAIQSLDGYATEGYVADAIDSKADSGHDHNDLYYTETEIDAKLVTMQSDIDSKVNVVDGMGLSTNDYTTAEKDKLAGIADGANAYVHPDYTPRGSGLYKLSIDEFGHVYEAAAVVKDDIVALGIPSEDTNTTYDDELNTLTTRVDELQKNVSDAQNSADQVAANLVGYMESNDTAVGNNTGNIAKNAGEIEAIKADHLTSADKEELNGRIDELAEDVGNLETDYSNYKESVASQFANVKAEINEHAVNTDNPHGVTATQVGLGNVDNTADIDKPVSYAIQEALDKKADLEHMHADATTDTPGFMSTEDKAQLIKLQEKVGDIPVSDQITEAIAEHVSVSGSMVYTQNHEPTEAEDGAVWIDLDADAQEGSNIVVDSALSKFSSNPIQNRAVKIALDNKADLTTTNAAIQENASAIAAERTRIDELLKLNIEEGSTTGDVELTDIRVGYDGTTYDTAGTAVRTQIQNLVTALDEKGNFNIEDLEVFSTRNDQSVTIHLSDGTVEKNTTIDLPVDDVLSIESNNPVRNSVIAQEIAVINEEIETLKEEGLGGGDTGTVMRLTNQNGTASLTTSYGSAAILMFTFTSTIDDVPTGAGTCKISVNGINKITMTIPQGLSSVDISSVLAIGSNAVTVTVTDIYDKTRILNYSVNVIQLIIESSFDATVPYTGDITYKYTAYGAVEKTIHFVIDGTEVGTVVTSLSGKQATRTISAMSHGAHKLEVYSTAEGDLKSPKLVYDIICLEDESTDPIIASACGIESVSQGEQISIPYIVYDPAKLACDITLTVYTMDSGSEVVYSTQSITVDRSQQYWNMRKYPVGSVYFRIQYGEIYKTHNITVEESSIKIEAETNDLELHLYSDGRSNNETDPGTWTYGDVTTTFENVNWTTTGWIPDENGDTCLRLNGTATAEVQFQPFKDDLRIYGKTIELEFTIRDVNNRDATVISCMSGDIGFEVKPDKAYIKSEGNQVFCNYKDEERVRLSFVIEASNESRLLLMYLNGVLSDAVQYTTTDNFQQLTPVNITIGSPYCGVDVYNIRSYSTALPSQSVVNNYLADMVDVVRKTDIFEANDIYDEYGQISFAKAREKNSCMIIIGTLPVQKGDKKSSKIVYYDVEDSNLNFEDNATIDVQGTSSQWSKSGYRIE